ncbi:hypothetical protein [Streptomyces californicus]|uniref:hypothetical protein n=1 Tax=Streptomyces californicus TaxID=67351 RepID=UPI00296F55AA|nr:hypothetical protein [Streptomyces californicus]MDW4912555.1 hypothetical protein [Streptomyces californicus]
MEATVPAEALLLVTASVVPGSDVGGLDQRLADAVAYLPGPAAAIVGQSDIPDDVVARAAELGERQGMAGAAADLVMYFARLWFRPSPDLPADHGAVAIACRRVWEAHLLGAVPFGVTDLVCLPAPDADAWIRGALGCTSLARTADAPPGLIPENDV